MGENQQLHLKILPFLELYLGEPCGFQNKYSSAIQRNRVRTRLWGGGTRKFIYGHYFKTSKEAEQ